MKARVMVCVLVMISVFALGLLPAAAQEDDCYSKDGRWVADKQQCVVTMGVQVNINYPLEMVKYPEVTKVIDTFVADQQKGFISSYTPDYTLPAHVNNWEMDVYYELYKYSEDIQTILFQTSFYTGGAHPNSGYTSMTFDVNTGKQLTLNDVFANGNVPLDTIAQYAHEDLKKQLGDMADPIMLDPGTAASTPDNYKNWALTPTSIIFFFDPYQVAPYAAGPQKVEIPFSVLGSALAAPFAG